MIRFKRITRYILLRFKILLSIIIMYIVDKLISNKKYKGFI